ncbi:MAG: Lrp/AsnC family transcriptional regulator, regulator for asnA, asnC and gidA [Solirubrobacteraceae bacterium]|jgi:Lrp/AsnC family transcriptional regulator for asnA, asnC and gidA|nr:Lrp/AsnC family transcriptional regulator, regulator for asnA, asnC and gidA [Solirubrobacteraceae bacterium]
MSSPLDAIDRGLIALLQEDGRLPYSRLAPAVGLSEAATRQRVQRLIDSGVIQVVAVADPLRTGGRIMAMVGVRVEGDVRSVAEALARLPEAIYVVATSGPYDVLAELVCDDHDHLLRVLDERVRAVPGVRSTESWLELGVFKHSFAYGTGP